MRGYGKIILFGEHAVVYGYPALAAAISKGVNCTIRQNSAQRNSLFIPEWHKEICVDEELPLAKALQVIIHAMPQSITECRFDLELQIPVGAGLGNSAAISVAIIRALLNHCRLQWSLEKINALAFEAEKIFHGTPSGLDNTVSTFGSYCFLADNDRFPCPFKFNHQFPLNKRTASLLSEKPKSIPLVVINTLRPRRTKEMVDKVRLFGEKEPELFKQIADQIGKQAINGYRALLSKDYSLFGEIMNTNQHYLQKLGVSCPELDEAIQIAWDNGAMGAKLTGAGGGGCLIAYAPQKEQQVIESCRQAGYPGFVVEIGP